MRRLVVAIAVALIAGAAVAQAQSYPSHPVTLVVPFPPADFRYEGKRSIVFGANDKVPAKQLSHCIAMALTYHLAKK